MITRDNSATIPIRWRLGEILLQKQWISWEQLDFALKSQAIKNDRVGQILLQNRMIDERQLVKALAIQAGVEFVELSSLDIDRRAIDLIPGRVALKYRFMPIELGHRYILAAFPDPFDEFVKKLVSHIAQGREVAVVVSTPDDIAQTIAVYYENPSQAA